MKRSACGTAPAATSSAVGSSAAHREAARVGGRALIAAQVVGVGLRQIPDEGAERREGRPRLRGVVELVELVLARLDDEDVAVAFGRVAGVVGAALRVAAHGHRHLQRHGIAVRAAVAVRVGGARRDRLARRRRRRRRRAGSRSRSAAARRPSRRRVERLDDRGGARRGRQLRDVLRPRLGLREEAADRRHALPGPAGHARRTRGAGGARRARRPGRAARRPRCRAAPGRAGHARAAGGAAFLPAALP